LGKIALGVHFFYIGASHGGASHGGGGDTNVRRYREEIP
jgi:hypothetical protein